MAVFLLSQDPGSAGQFCAPYPDSTLYRQRARQIKVDPSNWIRRIEDAESGDEFLLSDGLYVLGSYALTVRSSITIRSSSGNRERVLIKGRGYDYPGEGIMILGAGVTIADLSITGIRNHGVSIKGESGADSPHLYNLHIFDIGTQHIKGTPSTEDGVVACSRIGYTPGGVQGDYINGIDIHGAKNWTIRDNELYNIWGDGTGCEVEIDCGRYQAGGGPAILLWNGAAHNKVVRNRIINCYRGIALGFEDQHQGGRVQNNFVVQTVAESNGVRGDAGISIRGQDISIDHNTVILGTDYRGAIEVRDSSGLRIRNNLLSAPVWNRLWASSYLSVGNASFATLRDLQTPLLPHLASDSEAIDSSSTIRINDLETDIDGEPRALGASPDAGCDETHRALPYPGSSCI